MEIKHSVRFGFSSYFKKTYGHRSGFMHRYIEYSFFDILSVLHHIKQNKKEKKRKKREKKEKRKKKIIIFSFNTVKQEELGFSLKNTFL